MPRDIFRFIDGSDSVMTSTRSGSRAFQESQTFFCQILSSTRLCYEITIHTLPSRVYDHYSIFTIALSGVMVPRNHIPVAIPLLWVLGSLVVRHFGISTMRVFDICSNDSKP